MYKPEVRFTGLIVFFLHISFKFAKKIRVARIVGLHGHIDRLYDDQHMIVFIQYVFWIEHHSALLMTRSIFRWLRREAPVCLLLSAAPLHPT
jgi:G:T-mismatch repair DNA endonuclease (very short patch repair protein)